MPSVPNFAPSANAPLFANGPWPPGTNLSVSIFGLPPVSIDATAMGFCGGMSFLTRDIFEAGTPQLQGRQSDSIPLPLAQHLLDRLVQSFDGPPIVRRWIAATQALDHDTIFWGPGLFRQTVAECPGVTADIDAGILCPIAVVLVQSWGVWDVFQNHVELVWGYERAGDILRLHTYDCNAPGRDDMFIELDDSAPAPAKTITTNGTHGPVSGRIRGFFRLPYTHADPSPAYIDDGRVVMTQTPPPQLGTRATADVTLIATNTGSTTWKPADGFRLGSQDPQDNTLWGMNRVELPFDIVPDLGVAVKFTVTAPATAGQYAMSWQMVHELVRWFGTRSPSMRIGVGATGGICDQLHQQHVHLAEQIADVKSEIAGIDWSDPFIARHEAAALAAKARALQTQVTAVEATQTANGCAPG